MTSTLQLLSLLAVIASNTVAALPPSPVVDIGTCKNFAVQAETDITFGGTLTTINSGDIGVSPGTSITGNYKLVMGTAHSNDAQAKQCTSDMQVAYTQAQSQKCTNIIASDLSGQRLIPGVYCTPSGKFIISAGSVTLDALGNPYSEWVFQTVETLITAGATSVVLADGARAENVYWAIGSSATLGASSKMVGNILAQVSITFGSSSEIEGRGLAQAAVTFASGSQSDTGMQTIGLPRVYATISTRSVIPMVKSTTPAAAASAAGATVSVSLGGCENSALQAETSITFGGTVTTINSGDIGVSPGTSITGSYRLVSGTAHSNDAYAQQCTADMKTSYDQAASLTCNNLIATDLSDMTLTPGVYCSGSGDFTLNSGSLYLDAQGNPNAEWVFQTATTLITSSATSVVLQNGARANKVFWAIGTSVTLGSTCSMVGTLLAKVSITFGSGSSILGRGLAQSAITFASGSSSNSMGQSVTIPSVQVTTSVSSSRNLRG